MHSYELTERGKIVIAVFVALILLALALVLAVKTFTRQDSVSPDNQSSALFGTPSSQLETPTDKPAVTPPETLQTTANSPPPDGGDITPPEVSLPTASSDLGENAPPNGTGGNEPPGGLDNTEPPSSGPTGGAPAEGTLSFLFSPDYQSELDADTASLIGVLLNSPNNTRNSTIAVATPRLSDSASTTLMAAVVRAFDFYGVSEQRIAHIENSTRAAGKTFEVSFYFIPSSGK